MHALLHLFNEGDAAKVHIVVCLAEGGVLVYRRWVVLLASCQLTRTEKERQMLIIIQPPHPMTPSRLEQVLQLNLAHEQHILLEDFVYGADHVTCLEGSDGEHAEEENDEVHFVAGAIVYTFV